MQLVFLHGLETGPHGAKYQALQKAHPDLAAPDCTGIFDIEERLLRIEQALAGQSELLLVGSSFGGLAAALFASRHPARVAGAVLCAPAVHWVPETEIAHLPRETTIIHGERDDIVPLAASQALAQRFPSARLIVVDDEHRLGGALELIVSEAGAMMKRLAAR